MTEATPAPPRAPITSTRLAAAGSMVGLLTTLATQLVQWALADSSVPVEIQASLVGLVGLGAGAVLMTVGSWGRDNLSAGSKNIIHRFAAILGCMLVALWLGGCASFDRAGVTALAAQYSGSVGFSADECEAMREASQKLVSGPNKDLWVLGGGGERKTASATLDRISVRCDRVLQLDPTAPQATEARSLFNRTWAAAAIRW